MTSYVSISRATRRRLRRQQQLLDISRKNPGGPYDF